ncbi:hypothetical protein [Chryseobacterium cucumeris]|uniref:hypothetical protein n=1 Tax=Chryseobacterium cucumeris TaxID=1813611 RepID=UPI003D97B5B4
MNNVIVLSKDFAANESAVVDIKSRGLVNPLEFLHFKTKQGSLHNFSGREMRFIAEKMLGILKK